MSKGLAQHCSIQALRLRSVLAYAPFHGIPIE